MEIRVLLEGSEGGVQGGMISRFARNDHSGRKNTLIEMPMRIKRTHLNSHDNIRGKRSKRRERITRGGMNRSIYPGKFLLPCGVTREIQQNGIARPELAFTDPSRPRRFSWCCPTARLKRGLRTVPGMADKSLGPGCRLTVTSRHCYALHPLNEAITSR